MQDKLLELAIEIAKKTHKESIDKQNDFEIIDEKIVAILYDVVVNTSITLAYLIDYGFPIYIIDALKCLIKEKNVSYFDYINKIKENDLARKVKLVDLQYNIKNVCKNSLLDRYKKAYVVLTYEDIPQKTCVYYNGKCKLGIKTSCKSCKENNFGYKTTT